MKSNATKFLKSCTKRTLYCFGAGACAITACGTLVLITLDPSVPPKIANRLLFFAGTQVVSAGYMVKKILEPEDTSKK